MVKGDKYGNLTFIKKTVRIGYIWKGLFLCDCGNEKEAYISNVKKLNTRSCGCLYIEYSKNPVVKKHGKSNTPEYSSWMNMMYRCNNNNATGYEYYGGRGIEVCDRWHNFENFLCDMGARPKGTSIDRINTNGNYEPSNCKWSSKSEQSLNCRKDRVSSSIYKGVSFYKNSQKWEAYLNINGKRKRIGYFDSEDDAFNAYKDAYAKENGFDQKYPVRE